MYGLITATFASNPIIDPYYSLDAALAALWVEEHHPELYWSNTHAVKDLPLIDADLPLEKGGGEDRWWFQCSSALRHEEGREQSRSFWTKRWDIALGEYVETQNRGGESQYFSRPYKKL